MSGDTRPKANGCICPDCAEADSECTNLAPDGEDICIECELGIHERDRAAEPDR